MAEPSPSNAAVLAEVESLRRWMVDLARDTREGRDLALSIKTIIETQNIPAQIATLRGDMEKGFQAARSDLVNAQDHIRREVHDLEAKIEAHDARLSGLEQARARSDGATGLVGWLMRCAPWIFTGAAGLMAALGWKEKISG